MLGFQAGAPLHETELEQAGLRGDLALHTGAGNGDPRALSSSLDAEGLRWIIGNYSTRVRLGQYEIFLVQPSSPEKKSIE